MAALALAGCVMTGAPEQPPAEADQCGATALQHLIGAPESVLASMRFAQKLRVIHPGQAVTMDYNPARLNIEIDAEGRIATLRCG